MAAKTELLGGTATPVHHDNNKNGDRVLVTPADIEAIFGIPVSTQAKGRMTGDTYPFIKRGRSVYAFREDVEDWLRSLRRRSTSDPGQQSGAA